MRRGTCSIVVGVVVGLFLLASSAFAQITTGTISGRVADASGGVIPGATVVLISETRGTSSAPVVTNATGDYVFPNVTPDRYTVEVTLEAFKTVRRTGIVLSGGDRIGVPPVLLEPGGITETLTVVGETPLVQTQSGERSFAVATEQIQNLPVNRGNFTSMTQFVPGVNGTDTTSAGGTRLGGASQNNIMMDGISAMDTGNNGQMLSMNIESIGEVKVLTQGYQAEYGRSSGLQITAVTKSGTNQFRGSGYSVFTDSDWNEVTWVRQKNGDATPKDIPADLRLHHRRPGGEAGRDEQAVLLLRPRVPAGGHRDQRRRHHPVSSADGGRARRRLLPEPRQQRQPGDDNGLHDGEALPGQPDPGQPAVLSRPGRAQPLPPAERRRRRPG